ncbi:unnamed protein product [Allacma fusca]|uniref:RING-type domain-containing protein n=1 Tax=Allacma fusca TaxID=39272 RepID=A0A8J2JGY3_9HEXA|nr:unnamed protein product [Allacma fusca]
MKPHSRFCPLNPVNINQVEPPQREVVEVYDEQETGTVEGDSETEIEGSEGNMSTGKTLDFIQTFRQLVSKHFKCPICQSILKDPVTLECNHLFCQECLNEWIQVLQTKNDIKSCPVCRKLIRNSVDISDIPVSTMSSFLIKFAAIERVFEDESKQTSDSREQAELLFGSHIGDEDLTKFQMGDKSESPKELLAEISLQHSQHLPNDLP